MGFLSDLKSSLGQFLFNQPKPRRKRKEKNNSRENAPAPNAPTPPEKSPKIRFKALNKDEKPPATTGPPQKEKLLPPVLRISFDEPKPINTKFDIPQLHFRNSSSSSSSESEDLITSMDLSSARANNAKTSPVPSRSTSQHQMLDIPWTATTPTESEMRASPLRRSKTMPTRRATPVSILENSPSQANTYTTLNPSPNLLTVPKQTASKNPLSRAKTMTSRARLKRELYFSPQPLPILVSLKAPPNLPHGGLYCMPQHVEREIKASCCFRTGVRWRYEPHLKNYIIEGFDEKHVDKAVKILATWLNSAR